MRKEPITLSLVLVVAATLAFVFAGCTDSAPTAQQTCQPLKEPTPPPAVTGSGAVIVTDISGSMNGFAQAGSTRLFTLHDNLERAVRNALNASEPSPSIRRCYLGNGLDCQAQIGLRDLDRASVYNARESRLDLFMRADNQSGGAARGDKPADPIDPYRLAVLVTDGMQARNTGANETAPCMAGADPDCMAHLLRQRAEQGYGIWIGLLLLPFKGTHYPERPLDEGNWQRIQQHVAGLAQDSFFQGVNFKVARAGSAVPFETYQFEGVKPLLVIALSKDVQAGRTFIQQFGESVKRESVVQPSGAVYTMELSPISVLPRRVTKIALDPKAEATGASPVVGKRQPGLYDYLIECERNCSATLVATVEEQNGTQMVPDGVKVEYNFASKGGLPQRNLQISASGDKTYEMRLSGQQLREGSIEACLDLQAVLRPDPPPNAFWNALHADNMYEAPERLYGLREMIQKVLQAVTEQPRPTDRVRFRIERK